LNGQNPLKQAESRRDGGVPIHCGVTLGTDYSFSPYSFSFLLVLHGGAVIEIFNGRRLLFHLFGRLVLLFANQVKT